MLTEILKGLFRLAFGDRDYALFQEEILQTTLMSSFQQCSEMFQKRMARCQLSNRDSFHHGTMTEPMESSEHIRLLLVELMEDLGRYCLASSLGGKDGSGQDETNSSKLMIEATSNICRALAKSIFLDPYPEIQRSACDLVEILARLCPLSVRMHATGLLVPLTGYVGDAVGGAEQSSTSVITPIAKKCLFRHCHAKTRSKTVNASAAMIVMLPSLQMGNDKLELVTNEKNLPQDALVAYFQPMLELILAAFSHVCWGRVKVRSLETLQVLLTLAIPLVEESTSLVESISAAAVKVEVSNAMIRSIKDVLEAALASCHIIGANNHCSRALTENITSTQTCEEVGGGMNALASDGADSVEGLQSLSETTTSSVESSPRQMTSILLILNGMMKGSLCNKDATLILHEIDSRLAIPTTDWFHSSPSNAPDISSLLCHRTIINSVALNSSLAWALLEACSSFAQCCAQHQYSHIVDEKWKLTRDVIVDVSVGIGIEYLRSLRGHY
ncbi:LOW QUALITY PROTEIN: hypothetical protein ACHAXR_008497 [Thalassiosira sp. AJA248-18]